MNELNYWECRECDGVGLVMGCELYVRRWIRDGVQARRVSA